MKTILAVSSWGCSDLGVEDATKVLGSVLEGFGDMDMIVLVGNGMDGFGCGLEEDVFFSLKIYKEGAPLVSIGINNRSEPGL